MVFDYLMVQPLPSQDELYAEMHTQVNRTQISLDEMPLPFKKGGFFNICSRKNMTLEDVVEEVTHNYPVIILIYFDLNVKNGHYILIIGYNETGVFAHDPWTKQHEGRKCGPNIYLSRQLLQQLWIYSSNWGMTVRHEPSPLNSVVYYFYKNIIVITLFTLVFFLAVIFRFLKKAKNSQH